MSSPAEVLRPRRGSRGGDIVLQAGEYTGASSIVGLVADLPGEYTTITSLDPKARARFVWDGVSDHILQLEGQLVVLRVDFPSTPAGVEAVRLVHRHRRQRRLL